MEAILVRERPLMKAGTVAERDRERWRECDREGGGRERTGRKRSLGTYGAADIKVLCIVWRDRAHQSESV